MSILVWYRLHRLASLVRIMFSEFRDFRASLGIRGCDLLSDYLPCGGCGGLIGTVFASPSS